MTEDKDLKTPIQFESRIVTRLIHIGNAIELADIDKKHKKYIQNEIKLIGDILNMWIQYDVTLREPSI